MGELGWWGLHRRWVVALHVLSAALGIGCADGTEIGRRRPIAIQPPVDGPVGGGDMGGPPTGDGDDTLPAGPGDGDMAPAPGDGDMAGDGDTAAPVAPTVDPTADPFEVLGSDPSRNQVQGGQVCERLATIQCAGEAGCCSAPGRDFAACWQMLVDTCKSGLYLDAITGNPITGFDPTRAATAFEQMETLVRACDPGVIDYGASPDGLMGIVQGTVSAGGSCKPRSLIPAALEAAPHLASCQDPVNYACMPRALSDWTCDPKSGVGEHCVTDVNCQAGLYCPQEDPTSPALTGVNCAARKTLGQSCAALNECESLACRGGSCVDANVDAAYCLGS